MPLPDSFRVGYVVKRYPRYSETFIVNEILAHEKAGLDLDIFALGSPLDTHFQPAIARVRASVNYLQSKGKMADFWHMLENASRIIPERIMDVVSFRNEDANVVFQAIQLAIAIRKRGISHLHAHFATSATAVARIAAHLAGVTYSFTAHAKDIFHESVDEEELRIRLRGASATITVSEFNVDYLRETFGADAARVTRIYNGLDLDLFPYGAPVERPARILAVGRLVEKKGFDHLIDACALLEERGVDFECQIVGAGADEAKLQQLITDHAISHRVQLLGPRPQSEIIGMLRESSLFAAPCVVSQDGDRDGLPTVLLEAMALGTPCVSTDVTGIPEILRHKDTGLLVGQADAIGLADAMSRLLTDAPMRTRLAENARRVIENQFDIHRNAAALRTHFATKNPAGDSLPTSTIRLQHVA